MEVAPHEKVCYGFKFFRTGGRESVPDILYSEGLLNVLVVPGMVVPRGEEVRFALRAKSGIDDVSAEFQERTSLNELSGGKDGYEIYFKLLPHDLLISDGSIYNRGFREVQATLGQSTNDNLTSKVKYADLYDGIDFDYEIRPDSIKEDITVKSRRDNYTFAFKVFTNGLDIRLSEDGKEIRFIASVSLEDTSEGDTVFKAIIKNKTLLITDEAIETFGFRDKSYFVTILFINL